MIMEIVNIEASTFMEMKQHIVQNRKTNERTELFQT